MPASKQKEKENATRKITVRVTPGEYQEIRTAFQQTTKRKMSEYIRYVILGKPVTVYTRSMSLDDFTAQMILLRNELSAIGRNFNQAVKRLHSMEQYGELKVWVIQNEIDKEKFMKKTSEINEKIAQISIAWLHESAH